MTAAENLETLAARAEACVHRAGVANVPKHTMNLERSAGYCLAEAYRRVTGGEGGITWSQWLADFVSLPAQKVIALIRIVEPNFFKGAPAYSAPRQSSFDPRAEWMRFGWRPSRSHRGNIWRDVAAFDFRDDVTYMRVTIFPITGTPLFTLYIADRDSENVGPPMGFGFATLDQAKNAAFDFFEARRQGKSFEWRELKNAKTFLNLELQDPKRPTHERFEIFRKSLRRTQKGGLVTTVPLAEQTVLVGIGKSKNGGSFYWWAKKDSDSEFGTMPGSWPTEAAAVQGVFEAIGPALMNTVSAARP